MAEKGRDVEMEWEMIASGLTGYMTALFEIEEGDSPILREVAYSIWNECMNLYEEGLVKPQQDFFDVDDFIDSFKKTGVPEEIKGNREHLIRVLGKGLDTFLDLVDINSPLLRKVAYKSRRSNGGKIKFDWIKPIPFKAMPDDQVVEVLKQHYVPHLKLEQTVEKCGETIFWYLEAPKDENGKHCCGWPLVRFGIVKPSLKACLLDTYMPKLWVETLVKHPVEVEVADNPIVRDGASSCDVRVHLKPSAYTFSRGTMF